MNHARLAQMGCIGPVGHDLIFQHFMGQLPWARCQGFDRAQLNLGRWHFRVVSR